MKRFVKFLPLILLTGCVASKPVAWEPRESHDYPPVRTSPVYVEEAVVVKPDNWFVERKILNENEYVIARSMESTEYMWLTCKIEPTGITGLSLGIVQPDEIGYRNDPATIVFMVNGREVIFGPGLMVNETRAGLRSFDPRGNRFASEEERMEQINEWWNDEARVAQYEVIDQMRTGDFVIGEIQLPGIRREINVDLAGFSDVADQVLEACDRSDVSL